MAVIRYRNQVGQWQLPYYLYPKMWNGSQWVYVIPRYWDNGWKDFSYTGSYSVNVGYANATFGGTFFSIAWTYYGYSAQPPVEPGFFGAVTNAFGTISNTTISAVYFLIYFAAGTTSYSVKLKINNAQNTGWDTMTIGSTPYSRTNATFDDSLDTWTWITGPTNPFGTNTGASVNVTLV